MRAAFFDLDDTILRADTGTSWMKFRYRRGEIGRRELARTAYWSVLYKLAVLDIETLASRLVADIAGQPEADMLAACAAWHPEVLALITPAARTTIAAHQAAGDVVALLTGATQYAAEPVAAHLGVPHVLSTRLEVAGGRFTGKLAARGFGAHKVALAERFAVEHGVDLARSTFYSDSYHDRPMLERVGHPVAVNADLRLGALAWRRGWPRQRWA
ncbi:MAG: HAD-IB family hydrolase [Alphaproteobacteria bacterium]